MVFNENGTYIEKEYSIEELNEQVNMLTEAGLITKISGKAKDLLVKGKAVFRRKFKKVVDKNSGEDIEDTPKTKLPTNNTKAK